MFYCNRNCEKFNSIHKFECRAFSEISKHQYPYERLQNVSIILFLSILIKIKLDDSVIGEDIDQFNNLSDEFDKLKNDKEKIEKMTLFINSIELIMGSQFISKFTSNEIISNFGKMVLHQLEIKDQNVAIGMGIYLKPSKYLKHSCEPNSTVFFNGNKLYVKAERLVLNYEDPTISFCDLKLSDSERK
ncbi:histone-lysine N-methyltransferase SMYD3-like [Brachionus plicatilis]|uniref:Histone-lysine N-methyltransferase SMYD3-like n=1 Tax=Brachionus plicatilis TaxID=10195 RepID=A0A3M7P122_BRAPC|nr:histone-lysine N-methyltransferase SMYD3-like [Brachionus plicatilis]